MKRLLIIAILTLIIIPVIFASWLLNTERGLNWGYQQIRPQLPDSLSVSTLSGSLSGPLVLSEVSYNNKGQIIYADKVSLNWDPWHLLQPEVYIKDLQVEFLRIDSPSGEGSGDSNEPPRSLPQLSLPVDLRVVNADISTISISYGENHYNFDRVSASLAMQNDEIQISRLSLSGDNRQINLQGRLKPPRLYRHELSLQWTAGLASDAFIEGRGSLRGDLKSTRFIQSLQGAVTAKLELSLHDLLERPTWESLLEVSTIDSRLLITDMEPWKGAIRLNANGDTKTAALSGTVKADSEKWGPLNADFDLDVAVETTDKDTFADINVRQLNGELREYPVELQSKLRWSSSGIDLAQLLFRSGNTKLSAEGGISDRLDLRWSLDSNNLDEIYPQAEGHLRASGELLGAREAPQIRAVFEARDLRIPDYSVAGLKGALDFDFSRPEQFDLHLDASSVYLQGNMVNSISIDAGPGSIRSRLDSGVATAQIELQGARFADSWQGSLTQLDIQSGTYRDWRLKTPTAITLSSRQSIADDICLLGEKNAELCGHIKRINELWRVALDAKNLPLEPFKNRLPSELDIKGLVNARANLEYRTDLLGNISLDLLPGSATYRLSDNKIEQLDYREGQFNISLTQAEITVHSRIELPNEDFFEVQATMPGASLLAFDLDNQVLTGKAKLRTRRLGPVDSMITSIDNLQGYLMAKLAITGTTGEPKVSGEAHLTDASLSLPDINRHLTQINIDARGSIDRKIAYQGEALATEGRVKIRGDTLLNADQGWPSNITIEAGSFNLNGLLKPWLPLDTNIEGIVNANAKLKFRAPDNLTGELELWSPPGFVSYPLIEGELEKWEYRDARLVLKVDHLGISADAALVLADDNKLNAKVFLPRAKLLDLNRESQAIEGGGKLIFNDMAVIEALLPDINHLNGGMTMYADLQGVLNKPVLSLRAEVLQASLRIPRLGLNIDQINLRGQSDERNRFNFQLDAQSGAGRVEIKGSSQLDASSGWPTRLEITGENFEVSRIPEATISVSPQLEVKLEDHSIDVTGDLSIPQARLEPKDITTAARVSDDAVIIDTTREPGPEWRIRTRVNLILGDNVNFFGYGLESKFGGKILIEEASGQLTRGTGEVRIMEGRYRAYGQRLDIENGRLIFTGGPVTNPGLDISAVRRINDIRAGILARGTLKKPQVELFSVPAMGQTDTLSYILLGRPAETASGEDGNMMAKAALALGLAGGDRIARSLRERFGLDDIRLESNDTGDQTSLVLGRYLSPRLYVSYGVGLIDSFNTLNLRYQIADRWQLKTESGQNQGADILFTIER